MFDQMPQSYDQRRVDALEHAQKMLNLISAFGQYNAQPLRKYNFGSQANLVNQQINSDFLNSVLSANSDRTLPRAAAIKRRMSRH